MIRLPLARLSSLRACQRAGFPRLTVQVRRASAEPAWVTHERERLRTAWADDLAMAAAEGLPVNLR